ncbi:hypothetical protein KC345_g250 [Hortaea werneckii]|nr:hypothetical protein KC345_g250 [Hortaea werneckii]
MASATCCAIRCAICSTSHQSTSASSLAKEGLPTVEGASWHSSPGVSAATGSTNSGFGRAYEGQQQNDESSGDLVRALATGIEYMLDVAVRDGKEEIYGGGQVLGKAQTAVQKLTE